MNTTASFQLGSVSKAVSAKATGQSRRARSTRAVAASAQDEHGSVSISSVAQAVKRATAAAGVSMLAAAPAFAADDSSIYLTVGAGTAAIGVAAALIAADPSKRREAMAQETGGDEMESVRNYFNQEGFNRWNKIYGETDEVNKVQLDIRTGHAITVDKVLKWVDSDGGVEGVTVCDAGCGTGSLSIPLALRGAAVSGSDISLSMANEAASRYSTAAATATKTPAVAPVFEEKDLESITGKYNTVACLDVMIHYPQEKADDMVKHLASLAEERVIISFAPYTLRYAILKRIGELFPGPSKATRAYLHAEADVEKALNESGFQVTRREMTGTSFYFSRLLEAKKA